MAIIGDHWCCCLLLHAWSVLLIRCLYSIGSKKAPTLIKVFEGFLRTHLIDSITITSLEVTLAVNEDVKQPIKLKNNSRYKQL